MNFQRRADRSLSLFLALTLVFSGCVHYHPRTSERGSFMKRAQTQTQDGVTVTLAVLSNKEAKKFFGTSLAKREIQPVWLEIDNRSKIPYFLIPRNMDPNYYSAEEATYRAHFRQTRQFLEAGLIAIFFFPALAMIPVNYFMIRRANHKMDKVFEDVSMHRFAIMPGETHSGFLYTSVDQGTKHVKVDLLGEGTRKIFDFVVPIPGIKPDYTTKDLADRYPGVKNVDYLEKELPEQLAKIPSCTTDKKGKHNGDPINLIVIGELEDLVTIFTSAGWDETSSLTMGSGFAMAKAFFTGDNDRYSPISPLYYEGHSHDIAFQKNRGNINQRLHFRLWYTPMRYEKKPVWVGAISRDIGVKFTLKTWYMTTHRIDQNVDDSRDYLLEDLMEAQKVSRYAFIENKALGATSKPRKNLTNDPYFTDGRRLVIEISTEVSQLKSFGWGTKAEAVL